MIDFGKRPGDHECFDFHRDYVALVPDGNILETITAQKKSVPSFVRAIPLDQWEVIHEPYGWRVRTVVEHCCDAERVFGYRVLRFAAGDSTELPGWDENLFASSDYGNSGSPDELAEEFFGLRLANLQLLSRLQPEAFERTGRADGRKTSVRTITWLMAGHWIHHERILKKRLGL